MCWRRFLPALLILSVPVLGAGQNPAAAEAPLRVPIYNTARPPMVEIKGAEIRGILPDMFREILHHAGLEFTFDPVPVMRKRVLFEKGIYVLACCANPAWRNRPGEEAVQLFSKPFTVNRDILVFSKRDGLRSETRYDLSGLVVGVRRGFDYRGSQFFGRRLDLESEDAIFRALIAGHAQAGIVNEHTFHASALKDQLVEGPAHDTVTMHVRVQKSRQDLLPRINAAIRAFIADGTHDRIVRKYHMMGL